MYTHRSPLLTLDLNLEQNLQQGIHVKYPIALLGTQTNCIPRYYPPDEWFRFHTWACEDIL